MGSSNIDIMSSLSLLAFAGLLYILSGDFPHAAAGYPHALLGLLAGLAIIQLATAIVRRKRQALSSKAPASGDNRAAAPKGLPARVLLTGVSIIGYVALIPVLGYAVSTLVFLLGLMWLLNPKHSVLWVYAGVAVASTVVLYISFGRFLSVWLPKGILF